jgi:hypothetical protein
MKCAICAALMAVPIWCEATCHGWNTLGSGWQLGYVNGFSDGVVSGAWDAAVAIVRSADGTIADDRIRNIPTTQVWPKYDAGLTFGETRAGVTEICKHPENALIPVSAALIALSMKVKGAPQDQIDNYLTNQRRIASLPVTKPPR